MDIALASYESLIRDGRTNTTTVLPTEKELAHRWGVSQSAVNRAALRLIGAGQLRRAGYKLMPAATDREAVTLAGTRLAVLTHRIDRFAGLPEEASRRGVQMEELLFVGRDTLRHNLRLVAQKRFDGVIFLLSEGGWEWDDETAEFDHLKVPYVVCEEAPPGHNLVAEDLHGATSSLISHLASLGHTNIVFVGSLRRARRSAAVRRAFEETCLRLQMQDSVSQACEVSSNTREEVRLILRKIRAEYPAATAAVLFHADLVDSFLAAAKLEDINIPKDLSVVSVGDSAAARSGTLPITCTGFEPRTIGHMALDLICQNMLEVRRTGRLLPRQRLRLEAALRLRSSVAARSRNGAASADRESTPGQKTSRDWPQARKQRLREAEESWRQPHRLAAGARAGALIPVDLSSLVTRSLTHQNGWLGNLPLLHFGAGRKSIHGVTFDIIDEHENRGKGAIVLRSNRASTTTGRALPLEVAVPIRRRVRAIYFLHACGYASVPAPFAWYDFYLTGRRPISVPIVARGMSELPVTGPQPNIQDWWPEFRQFNSDGVRNLVVTKNGDPFDYERYLYTLEWENPFFEAELTTLYLRSNPSMETTLAVLGITMLCD